MRRVHRLILIFLAAMGLAFAAPAIAPAKAEAYLHVAQAESTAIAWVRYDVCDGWVCSSVYMQSYNRYSDSRVDVNVHVSRASGRQCERRVIVRGSDASRYATYDTTQVGWTCWG